MAKIRLTKGELKKERDALKQYRRYLPILQLKKQQLQMEILRESAALDVIRKREREATAAALSWAGLIPEEGGLGEWVKPEKIVAAAKNVAGLDIPVFERAEYGTAEYDLFEAPLWVDAAIEALRQLAALRAEIAIGERAVALLRDELRTTAQRVNLFEKIKIPQSEDAIRVIKIYIGDQMANAVGRSKIAKRKIEAAEIFA